MIKRMAIISIILVGSSLSMGGARLATANSDLPDPSTAGFAEKLYRLDCGHSLANDESVWTPGQNVGRSIEFSSTCWLIKRGSEWVLWDTGVPQATLNDPKGWSTLPKFRPPDIGSAKMSGFVPIRAPGHLPWRCRARPESLGKQARCAAAGA